ncbi:UDP-N-acetylmuramate dehydrogenase [Parageobacillus thermoglucosidasius]|uniref:UDP-N-acetylenolpyruvoylglucosamine reductase n=1 Tax=Parageobacillus thermoglucosidasius TaxID=1426 RepID=A0AAN0YMT8_PARTM|nr:UDP-N-acetylmuramate dehydrogenase [Parageobacillus thermoglucosidasius]KYD15091.1 UDP-N-acetylenolpyruvoylglucosamine reductase [Anoxybacillus flavithermus]REK53268.1 MAG: UDP-N-acetylmuramate dehydrogenase [Geobacillus sp.]ALF09906.1 UDP-N-acetylenolpyruvoylglucosamine reductase [Parageobacillus thermoglucosidasius]ANZ29987.1 UDP-N-acetylenolpyruvoylglucosamine reductase [Parageobacillus thermoglucosidasius]APM80725.1 UDP-N-acetylenolpyruvoylglucosamine reductase [Parageobacillus thermogl
MCENNVIYQELVRICGEKNVLRDEPLKYHTLVKIGGKADFLVWPETYEQVVEVIRLKEKHRLPFTLLGNGSNVIVRDGGIRGIVVQLKHLTEIKVEGEKIIAQSGADIKAVSRVALEHSLTGLEFACGIPGSVGGAIMMNAGAYDGEIKDVVDHVKVVTQTGEQKILRKDDLQLGYRTSIISKTNDIVLEAVFQLKKGDPQKIKEKMDDLTFRRESKQPLEYPSVGSVFKRPPGYFAGKLIQDSGLQGKGVGGAEVSTKHAGFIINKNNATASDYIATIELVRKTVKEKFGVDLELEVKIIGEDIKQ